MVAPPGNHAENGENKPQSAAFGETGLLANMSANWSILLKIS